ncbi:MAG: uroporphyrinogen-III synthase [Paludibacteraceae bacterium]|nr:uroporphyrinogen-III synthase [Paludibacteraceae bacterium]
MKEIHKILVSQPRPASDKNPYSELEEHYGVECDFHQLIHIEGLDVHEFRKQHIYIQEYTAVFMNSRLAIDHFFRLCQEMRLQVPEQMHYYCISEQVANYLSKYIQYRKRRVFYSEHNRFEDMIPSLKRRTEGKMMIVMSNVHSDDVINSFTKHKLTLTPAIMYRTVVSEWPKEKPLDHDMIVLFTPTGVAALKKNFPKLKKEGKVFACMGKQTIAAMQDWGIEPDIVAPTPEFPGITSAIKHYLDHLS